MKAGKLVMEKTAKETKNDFITATGGCIWILLIRTANLFLLFDNTRVYHFEKILGNRNAS